MEEQEREVEIIWAKADRGIWGLTHVFGDKLYLTRDIVDGSQLPQNFAIPQPKVAKPAPKPKAKAAQKAAGEHVQEFKMRYKRGKGFYPVPL